MVALVLCLYWFSFICCVVVYAPFTDLHARLIDANEEVTFVIGIRINFYNKDLLAYDPMYDYLFS